MFDSWSHDNDGNPCPMSCPVHCDYSAGEMWCPNPPMNGCWSMGGYCMAPSTDNCPASCPITCGEGEIFMPGEVGPDGCSCQVTAWHHMVTALPHATHHHATTRLVSNGVTMDMTPMAAGWDLIVQPHVLPLQPCKS